MPSEAQDSASKFSDKAKSLFSQGKYDEAITWYDKALEIDPNNIVVLINKGLALGKLGKYQVHIELYLVMFTFQDIETCLLLNTFYIHWLKNMINIRYIQMVVVGILKLVLL